MDNQIVLIRLHDVNQRPKKRVYNPNKGDTFLHQNSKALNQKVNADAKKSRERHKG